MITKARAPFSGVKPFVIMVGHAGGAAFHEASGSGRAADGARGREGRADVGINGLAGGFAGNLRAQEPLPRLR